MEITSFALNNFAPEKFFWGAKFVTMNTPQKFQECRFRLHYESVLWRTQIAPKLKKWFFPITKKAVKQSKLQPSTYRWHATQKGCGTTCTVFNVMPNETIDKEHKRLVWVFFLPIAWQVARASFQCQSQVSVARRFYYCSPPLYLRTRKKKRAKRVWSTRGWRLASKEGKNRSPSPPQSSLPFRAGAQLFRAFNDGMKKQLKEGTT